MSYYKVSGVKISEKNISFKIAPNNIHPIEYENYKMGNNTFQIILILKVLLGGDFQFNDKFSSIEKIAFLLTLKKIYNKKRKSKYEITLKDVEAFYKTLKMLKRLKDKNKKYIINFKGRYLIKINKRTYNYSYYIEDAKHFKLEDALNIKLLSWYKECKLIEVKCDN